MGEKVRSTGVIAAILGILLFLALKASAQTTIRVPSEVPTIQEAINAALDGDEVLVAPGTYVENINFFGKAITVRSEEGPEVTIIDGNQADSVVTFDSGEGSTSVFNGFTLQYGRSSFDSPGFGDGGGIRIDGSSPTITHNIITNNQACDGLGISLSFASPVIQRNTITNNSRIGCTGGTGGGGIKIGGASSAQILDNVISDNTMTAANGGGISLFSAGTPLIKGNVITRNTVSGIIPCAEGGGIAMANFSDAVIVQNLITGNRAGCGGGIAWLVPSGQGGPLLVNNTIADNDSPVGSGIFADGFDAQTELINNIVVAKADQAAVLCEDFNDVNPPIFKFNNIFSPSGTSYDGICTDQTGINGNISIDPLFVDQARGDYHIQSDSPVIDAGDNTAPQLPDKDIDGHPRILDRNGDGIAVVDIGIDELTPPITATPYLKDINGDGIADLLWRNTNSGATAVWLMNASGQLGRVTFPGGAELVWALQGVGDVNGDGPADLVWRHLTSGAIAVWLINPAGTRLGVTYPGGTRPGWAIQGVGDINGDGPADLVWRHLTSGAIAVWLMNPSGQRGGVTFPGAAEPAWVLQSVSDVNGDGPADLVWRHAGSGATAVWLMNPSGQRDEVTFPGRAELGWALQGVGDVNGDGPADLVWRYLGSGATAVWLMNPSGQRGGVTFPGRAELGWALRGVGDVNGDGPADLVWRHKGSGATTVWLMNVSGRLDRVTFPGTAELTWELQP